MTAVYTSAAQEAINDVAQFIDDINIEGAGERWSSRLLDFIIKYAQPNVQYSLCYYQPIGKLGFSCISFNNWIIIFKIEVEQFVVYQIAHASTLA